MSDALSNNGTGRAHGILPADVAGGEIKVKVPLLKFNAFEG